MSLSTSLILLAVVVLLDVLLVRLSNTYFKRHPLEESGVQAVRLRGRPLYLPTYLWIQTQTFFAQFRQLPRPRDFRLSAAMLLLGVVCVAVSQTLRPATGGREWPALLLLAIGLAVFAGGVLLIDNPQTVLGLLERPSSRLKLRLWQLPLLAISLPLSLAAKALAGTGQLMDHPVLAIGAYLAAITAVIAGSWPVEKNSYPHWKSALAWAAGMAVIALPLRVYRLGSMPEVMNGDEGSFALMAVSILKGEANNIFVTGWFSFPMFSFLPLALPIRLLGQTVAAARIVSALVGTATVATLYLFGRRLFGHTTALLAAFFLALLHYHIHFSRLAINNIWDGLFYVVILGCLWEAWRSERRGLYLLAGLALGFSQFFYASSRVLVVLLPIYLLGLALRDKARFRRALPNLGLMLLAALVVFAPLGFFYLTHFNEFMAPMNRVSLTPEWFAITARDMNTSTLGVLINQLKLSLQAYTDVNFTMWYDSHTPMLLDVPAVLFLLGIVLLLARRCWTQAWLLGCWLGIISLTGALSQDTPAAQRYVAAAPAVALLVAYAVQTILELLRRFWPQLTRLWQVSAVLLMAWIGWREYQHYFLEYIPRSYFDENTLTANYLAGYLKDKPAGTELCFFGAPQMGYDSISSLPYLAPDIRMRNCSLPWSAISPAPSGKEVFVFLPHLQNALAAIQSEYPEGKLTEVPGVERPVLIWLYDLTS